LVPQDRTAIRCRQQGVTAPARTYRRRGGERNPSSIDETPRPELARPGRDPTRSSSFLAARFSLCSTELVRNPRLAQGTGLMARGGPDDSLVRAAQPQEESREPRLAVRQSPAWSLWSLRAPNRRVVWAARGSMKGEPPRPAPFRVRV